jgi:UDP-hydrolysing UDP-N-acetyl-D-glucosamine 2-epimerase
MKEIDSDPDLKLQTLVCGMHLAPEFGLTYRLIEADGFEITSKVDMLLSTDSPVGTAKSMGMGLIGFADALDHLKPDILVVLGDRFEIMAVAMAAMVARVPVAHISGGEVTEGAIDESIRHAITKIAQWHFVAAESYRRRVIQLGENPKNVFNFGAPGLDYLEHIEWLDRNSLEVDLGMKLEAPVFLVTYHPTTLGREEPLAAMEELLISLDGFPEAKIIFTYPNADTGGRSLINRIESWVENNKQRARAFVSLGQRRYLSLMRESDVVIGNSSSGITEAPFLRKATVNIGDRQKGRLKATSIIDATENRLNIVRAIRSALSLEFRGKLLSTNSLYGHGSASKKIKDSLKILELENRKIFFDIDHGH